jgi:hypothetical protein
MISGCQKAVDLKWNDKKRCCCFAVFNFVLPFFPAIRACFVVLNSP